MKLDQPPSQEAFMGIRNMITRPWVTWFQQIYRLLFALNPSVSSDNGDNAVTLTAGKSALTQRFATTLTANRTVTLSTTGVYTGAKFRVVREAGANGAFDLDVGGLKTLSGASEWADVEYSGQNWILTGSGSL